MLQGWLGANVVELLAETHNASSSGGQRMNKWPPPSRPGEGVGFVTRNLVHLSRPELAPIVPIGIGCYFCERPVVKEPHSRYTLRAIHT